MDRGALRAAVHGVARVGHDWVTFTTTTFQSTFIFMVAGEACSTPILQMKEQK